VDEYVNACVRGAWVRKTLKSFRLSTIARRAEVGGAEGDVGIFQKGRFCGGLSSQKDHHVVSQQKMTPRDDN
jgi:hypothetical protein